MNIYQVKFHDVRGNGCEQDCNQMFFKEFPTKEDCLSILMNAFESARSTHSRTFYRTVMDSLNIYSTWPTEIAYGHTDVGGSLNRYNRYTVSSVYVVSNKG